MKRISAEVYRDHDVPVRFPIAARREFATRGEYVLNTSLIEFDPSDPNVVV